MSLALFNLVIDWIMQETHKNHKEASVGSFLYDLDVHDFGDDIVLLSHKYQHVQEKAQGLKEIGSKIKSIRKRLR